MSNSALSGWGIFLCPVWDHGLYPHPIGLRLVGWIFSRLADQNHPLRFFGSKSLRPSQPVKETFLWEPENFDKKWSFTVKITQASWGPDVWHVVLLDELEDKVVLFLGFDGDGVHAEFTAKITSFQPIDTLGGQGGDVSTVEVIVAFVVELLESWNVKGLD